MTHQKWKLQLANWTLVLLFLASVGLLHWIGRGYSVRFDLSDTGRHSLSDASVAATEHLTGSVEITAYASSGSVLRTHIRELVGLYQNHKADISLTFIDPDESPDKVRAAGAQEGELQFVHGNATERLAPPSRLDEEAFTNTLTRLGHRGERWVVFLSGHGERSPDRQANFDLSNWADELRKRGFKTRVMSLAESPQVPENTSVFVIAGPRTGLLPGEVKAIQSHIEKGGTLLWLAEPGAHHGLEALAEMFGIEFLAGVVVDPVSEIITGQVADIVIAAYGPHPVVRDFVDVTRFPKPGALHLVAPKGWEGNTLLDTRESAWLETGSLDRSIVFDRGKDKRGPLTLGVALTRTLNENKTEQRVIVITDGDFLSNTFLANGVNLDLGLSIVNWLSHDDAYVSIPVRVASDLRLDLSSTSRLLLVISYLGVPLAAATTGFAVWWRRRKR